MSIARKTRGIHRTGTRAAQPAADAVLAGTLYYVEDEGVLERSTGQAWLPVSITGEKVDIAFDAGLFTANGGGTWTVASGDVEAFNYTRLGSGLVMVQYGINTSTVAGSPTQLRMEVPFTIASTSNSIGRYFDLGAVTGGPMSAVAAGGGNQILCILLTGTAWPNRTDEVYVFGTVFFAI